MPELSTTFAALGDPVRFAIAERLLTSGPLSAGDLGGVADISAPAISRHLKVLRNAGVITQTIDKQRRIYAINPPVVQQITRWTQSHAAFWEPSLDRLAHALEEGDT